jgi:ribosomal protein S18 acetylase RimI-like enzyme
MNFTYINASTGTSEKFPNKTITHFLHKHLEEFGDTEEDIQRCIDYVLNPDKGGQIIIGTDEDKIVGIVILNNTGMKDYIPENILVYIAIDNSQRGKGYGKKLMEKAISSVEGNIALHVEQNNPAKALYEKLGFTNKYLEMRLIK